MTPMSARNDRQSMATAGVGIGPRRNTSMPVEVNPGNKGVLDHIAGKPRVLADHDAVSMFAALECEADSHADLHRDIGCHRIGVCLPANTICAKIFASHFYHPTSWAALVSRMAKSSSLVVLELDLRLSQKTLNFASHKLCGDYTYFQ